MVAVRNVATYPIGTSMYGGVVECARFRQRRGECYKTVRPSQLYLASGFTDISGLPEGRHGIIELTASSGRVLVETISLHAHG